MPLQTPSAAQVPISLGCDWETGETVCVGDGPTERLESAISPVLREEGYEQVSRFAYKGRWGSADVEHFVYFEEGGKTKGLFSGSFGITIGSSSRGSLRSVSMSCSIPNQAA